MTEENIDAALKEVKVQLEILQTLQKVPGHHKRERIMLAVKHLLEADALVPGLFDAVSKGLRG